MTVTSTLAVTLTLVLVFPVVAVGAELTVGTVTIVRGAAFVRRAAHTQVAQQGQALRQGDILVTGADGRLGVTLRDDTRLSLGPETELQIDRFVFAPAQGNLALVLKIARGVAAYVSGRIAKLSPGSVHVETPVAIVGVRGTHFAARVESE
ncbi:MAG: FecR family protein [Actinomycetota bacterium]